MRTRVAVSVMRPAILIRRMRRSRAIRHSSAGQFRIAPRRDAFGLAPHPACLRQSLVSLAPSTSSQRATISIATEPSGTVAQRYGISAETVRKWRKHGAADCLDRSARPHQLSWKPTQEERAVDCILRCATNFPLDDLTFVVSHFLPHLRPTPPPWPN